MIGRRCQEPDKINETVSRCCSIHRKCLNNIQQPHIAMCSHLYERVASYVVQTIVFDDSLQSILGGLLRYSKRDFEIGDTIHTQTHMYCSVIGRVEHDVAICANYHATEQKASVVVAVHTYKKTPKLSSSSYILPRLVHTWRRLSLSSFIIGFAQGSTVDFLGRTHPCTPIKPPLAHPQWHHSGSG